MLKVLYEDKNILAIDKPSGISVHGDGKTDVKTLADFIVEDYPEMENIGEPILAGEKEIKRPGIVHRLDKDTSGVLLLAKNQEAHEFLKKQFQNREVRKTYHAIVSGFIKSDSGVIDKPIGRSPNDFRRRLAGRGARGEMREAITEYTVLKRFEDENGEKFSYVEVHPKTGRTHQIRVHMKFLSYPVACDSLYNPDKPCPVGISRLALHAKSIEFKNLDGKEIKVEAPLPDDFKKFTK